MNNNPCRLSSQAQFHATFDVCLSCFSTTVLYSGVHLFRVFAAGKGARRRALLCFPALLLLLALAGCGGALVEGRGGDDAISEEFRVTADCPRQVLTWSGAEQGATTGRPWANFHALDAGLSAAAALLAHFDEQPSGEAVWRLPPGRYVVEVNSYAADWRFRLNCRE